MAMVKDETFLRNLVLFSLMGLVVLLFWGNNLLVTVLLLLESLAAGLFFYKKAERLFFVLTGFFGVVLETIGGLFGIWTYTFPNFFTVPIWIFFC